MHVWDYVGQAVDAYRQFGFWFHVSSVAAEEMEYIRVWWRGLEVIPYTGPVTGNDVITFGYCMWLLTEEWRRGG